MAAMEDTVRFAGTIADRMPKDGPLSYAHLADMLERMRSGSHSYGKQCRWLGWAQCALVAAGVATLDDVKEINKRHAD